MNLTAGIGVYYLALMDSLKIFRAVSLAEGISLLVLLFVAMPLKYILEIPMAVKVVGWMHGLLFILYAALLLIVWINRRWTFLFAAGAFAASLIPFGTFILDRQIRKKEALAP